MRKIILATELKNEISFLLSENSPVPSQSELGKALCDMFPSLTHTPKNVWVNLWHDHKRCVYGASLMDADTFSVSASMTLGRWTPMGGTMDEWRAYESFRHSLNRELSKWVVVNYA